MTIKWSNISAAIASIAGVATAFILFDPQDFQQWPVVGKLAAFIAGGGMLSWGITSNREADIARNAQMTQLQANNAVMVRAVTVGEATKAETIILKDHINSKMDALLKSTGEASYLQGRNDQRKEDPQ